jgi:hypothetical protein
MTKEEIEEWLDVPAACRIIGGTRPIHPATYYRGVKRGIYPPPEQRGANVKRISGKRLAAALEFLSESARECSPKKGASLLRW